MGFEDVFTKEQCLLNIEANKYGKLLDFITISLRIGVSVELIVTTRYLICVQNKIMVPSVFLVADSCQIIP